jgi:hypothetical protein
MRMRIYSRQMWEQRENRTWDSIIEEWKDFVRKYCQHGHFLDNLEEGVAALRKIINAIPMEEKRRAELQDEMAILEVKTKKLIETYDNISELLDFIIREHR